MFYGIDEEDWGEDEDGFNDDVNCEYDFRHPGTHWESDDENERGDNDIFSPIATKAGQELGSILFAGPGGTPWQGSHKCPGSSAANTQARRTSDRKGPAQD